MPRTRTTHEQWRRLRQLRRLLPTLPWRLWLPCLAVLVPALALALVLALGAVLVQGQAVQRVHQPVQSMERQARLHTLPSEGPRAHAHTQELQWGQQCA